jgi:hypothetical protein
MTSVRSADPLPAPVPRRRVRRSVLPAEPDMQRRPVLQRAATAGWRLLRAWDDAVRVKQLLPGGPELCSGHLLYGQPLRLNVLQLGAGLPRGRLLLNAGMGLGLGRRDAGMGAVRARGGRAAARPAAERVPPPFLWRNTLETATCIFAPRSFITPPLRWAASIGASFSPIVSSTCRPAHLLTLAVAAANYEFMTLPMTVRSISHSSLPREMCNFSGSQNLPGSQGGCATQSGGGAAGRQSKGGQRECKTPSG